jgi:hypothetical protein
VRPPRVTWSGYNWSKASGAGVLACVIVILVAGVQCFSVVLEVLKQAGHLGGSSVVCQRTSWPAVPYLRWPGMGRDLATATQVDEWLFLTAQVI